MDEIFSNPSCSWVVSGGYMLGEQLFFTGPNETFANGDKVVHGQQGMVTGSATSKSHTLKGVKVLFPGNKDWVDCYLYQVRSHAVHTPRCVDACLCQRPNLTHEQPRPQPTHAWMREG